MKAALVGDHIGPSLTPALHEREGAALGLAYSYERFDTGINCQAGDTLEQVLNHAEDQGFCGLNVTHPHKAHAAELMDELVGSARDLAAVNTVLFRDGRRIGHNTDCPGFRRALLERIGSVGGQTVLQAGAGGAGRAVALALAECGVSKVFVLDANPEFAYELCERLEDLKPEVDWCPLETIEDVHLEEVSGFVNCTPLGMENHPGMALDPSMLEPAAWVADVVYFPKDTALVRAARQQGLRVMDGTGMALWQAVEAFALITDQTANPRRMAKHLNTLLEPPKP